MLIVAINNNNTKYKNMGNILEKETSLIRLENISVEMLPELQGWKEKQLQVVKDNPFIKIVDNKTYEVAKKRRTNYVTARTDVEKQDKLIASKLKQVRGVASCGKQDLINVTLPGEEKQQIEVRRWEDVKNQEKAEKQRLEEERKDKIKSNITRIFDIWTDAIKSTSLDSFDANIADFTEKVLKRDTADFEEFEFVYIEKTRLLNKRFLDKKAQLDYAEKQRLEDERLKKEREAFKKQQADAREKEAKLQDRIKKRNKELFPYISYIRDYTKVLNLEEKEYQKELSDLNVVAMETIRFQEEQKEKRQKEQDKIDADNKKKAIELAKKEAKIKEAQDKIDAEKRKKDEAEREAKVQVEIKTTELEAKKRAEALKPDVEKLMTIINAIGIHAEAPELKDLSAKTFYTNIQLDVQGLRTELKNKLHTIK
jgi:hypothetical protein